MEDPFQQKRKESPYKDQNEEQGGIRRRLRDRDLLRKRKAEAEEKETNQEESPTKRRTGNNGGAKKRGRPRKAEPELEISGAQEEAAVAAGPAVVASEPVQINPDQTFFTLTAVESQTASVTAAPLSVFGSVQSSTPALASPASTNLTQPPSVLLAAPTKFPGEGQFPAQEDTPASAPDDPVLIQAPAPAAPPAADVCPPVAPNEMQGQDKEGQVTIEDVGPDEEEDLSVCQTKRAEEDVKEIASADMNEQSKMPSAPSLSSPPPPPQEYVSGNSL